jgi:metallo-beta-lactamase family protein
MKIQFLGATQEVTGSKHLITLENGKKILLDCGMFQGKGAETDACNRDLGFNPEEVDYMILSHAHIDHSGLIPYIINLGFKGIVLCTPATRDLCSIMLADCGKIQENDTKTDNKKRARQGMPEIKPIYTQDDAAASMQYFVSVPYNMDYPVCEGVRLKFTDTGHILGAAAVNLEIKEGGDVKRLCYTSDIGRPGNAILREPQPFPQADYIITESTYGDRLHENREDSLLKLKEVTLETCLGKKGKLIIPSFSVGRTQEIVYAFNRLFNKGWLPKVKIYVDSPLSVNATNIMRMHPECFNKDILELMKTDPDPFGFNDLFYITDVEDSKRLNTSKEPCVIISSSGMMEAGRIKHHLANNISDEKNTILIVGYCEPKTLGGKIKRGDKEVSIHGKPYKVKAEIRELESFSAHGDYAEMMVYLGCQDKKLHKKIFLVHGEAETIVAYKKSLEFNRFINIEIPEKGSTFTL